jgi:hypothetical protein
MPLEMTGTVSSLTQIQVYVDNVFSVTIPLDEGATTFSHALIVSAGSHVVRLVGISPFADISPTATLTVTYAPPELAGGGLTTSAGTTTTATKTGGAIISRDGSETAATTYVEPPEATSLPGWLYTGLLALDIARPGDTDDEIVQMFQRFVILAPAFFILIFARPTLFLYRLVRYDWLGLHEHPFPKFMRRHSLFHIRILGILLIFGVFSFS